MAAALGYVVTLGSALVKWPQVVRIVRERSVRGLSPFMFRLELLTQVATTCYHVARGSPFRTYGENVMQGIPNVVVLFLIERLPLHADETAPAPAPAPAPPPLSPPNWWRAPLAQTLAGAVLAVLLVRLDRRAPRVLDALQALTTPAYLVSRVPQVLENARSRDTGTLSLVTYAGNLAGAIARIYTTRRELGGDWLVLAPLLLSVALNSLLCAQILAFGGKGGSGAARRSRAGDLSAASSIATATVTSPRAALDTALRHREQRPI